MILKCHVQELLFTMNFEEMAHDNPNYMQFMGKVVKLKMVFALLGLEAIYYDNPTGFATKLPKLCLKNKYLSKFM